MIWLLSLLLLSINECLAGENLSSDYRVQYEQSVRRVTFDVFEENAAFIRQGKNLGGYGLGILVNYALNSAFSLGVGVSQVLSLGGDTTGVSALYTALRTNASFALFGSFLQKKDFLVVNGETIYTQQTTNKPVLLIEVGLEEFLFNGTAQVSPGSGLTAGISFKLPYKNVFFLLGGRSGILSLGGISTIPLILDIGISLRM